MCSVQEAAHLIISSDIYMELQIMPGHNFITRPGFGCGLTSDTYDNAMLPLSRQPSIGWSPWWQQCGVSSIILDSIPSHPPITSHPETMPVTIHSDDVGFGINLRGEQADDPHTQCPSGSELYRWFSIYRHGVNVGGAGDHHNRPIIIAKVIPDGPAFRYILIVVVLLLLLHASDQFYRMWIFINTFFYL